MTSDMWSDIKNRLYISITVHFVKEAQMFSLVLTVHQFPEQSKTGENIRECLVNLCSKVGISLDVLMKNFFFVCVLIFLCVFLYFHQQEIYLCSLMLFLFLLLCLCYFKFESQKYMNQVFSSNSVSRLVLRYAVCFTQTLGNTPQYLTVAMYVFCRAVSVKVAWVRIYLNQFCQ